MSEKEPTIQLTQDTAPEGKEILSRKGEIELKAGWNGPVEPKMNKDMVKWNRIVFIAMVSLLLPTGIVLLVTGELMLGFFSLCFAFLGAFAFGAVEFGIRFRKARGTTIDIKDIDPEKLLIMLDVFLRTKNIHHVGAREDYLILKGTGFELPLMELRLLTFPMKVTKNMEPGILKHEAKYMPKRMKVIRLGIRNVDQSNYLHAIQLQILLDGFFISQGITGVPQFYNRKVAYQWNGRTYESVYD